MVALEDCLSAVAFYEDDPRISGTWRPWFLAASLSTRTAEAHLHEMENDRME